MAYRSSQECNSLNPRLEEVRAALRTDEVKTATSKMTLVERAVWLVDHKLFRIPDVSVVLDLSPNVVRSALGAVHEGRVIGHVGRPRTLHDDSEKELCDKITSKSLEGHPLTKAQCLVLANEIYQHQLEVDRQAGRINPEKEISWKSTKPRLSASFMGGFLHRHPDLPTKSAHNVARKIDVEIPLASSAPGM